MIESNCFVGPWDQKRNFSWTSIDHVNINSYVSSNFSDTCRSFHPPDIDSEDDSLYEQKKSLKSASSNSSLKKSSLDYSKPETKTKSANSRLKKKSSNEKTNKTKSLKGTKSKSLQKNTSASNSLVSINKIDHLQHTCNKLDHVKNRIDAQISNIRTGQQKYYINHEVPDINHNYAHNVQSLSKVNHFDSLFGEKIYSNYNPSTVYRLKKLQSTAPELFNRRRNSTNLIATLETDTDYDKPFKKPKNNGTNQTKCAHCNIEESNADSAKSQVNKSPKSNCSCSENEFDTSELSFNETRRQTMPIIAQRVKSVSIIRNKNIEFSQGNAKINEMKIQTYHHQPILKIHKYGSNSNLAALKQYSSTAITMNKKINRSNSNHNGECDSKITVAKNLVNKNNIELELIGTDFDNSFSSSRSRANPSPCGNYNKNYHFKKVITGSHSNVSNNNSIKHHRDIYLQKKYPEAISVSGKSFLASDGNLSYDNKNVRILLK